MRMTPSFICRFRTLHRRNNSAISSLDDYSESSNPSLNHSKTKWNDISAPQMARTRKLEQSKCKSNVGIPWLERVPYTNLLGVHGQLDQNLT